ncbi:MAG: TonB-dependent receptor [Acidobacteria bacterium]|nr:MAG: TonB-dependent receptor [Acidobacteriota bacterium]MCE7958148.1 TonB-dependent receptor [Acidobacteria bacterium ACB2]
MRRFRRLLTFTALLALALAAGGLHAQTTGTTTGDIRGRVRDDAGLPLPGVLVTATNRETGLSRTHVTDADGGFVVPLLSPGTYSVQAELSLFAPSLAENVRVVLGTATAVDFTLRPAQAAEAAVTVTAESPLIDTTKTDLAAAVDAQQIRSLPNVDRNFLSFSLTTPRVSNDRGPQSGAAATSGFSINGVSPRLNNLAVDGFDNNDQSSGAVRAQFSQEAVQEYQVITNPYNAEFGRTAGGVINIVTRSGTNDFRGSAFYYWRSDSLATEDPLTNEKVPLDDDRFGGSFGGRLARDRTFFFAAYEHQGTDTANPVTISDADVALIRGKGFDVENGNVAYEVRTDAVVGKIDHSFSPSQILTLRGSWSKGFDENRQAWGGLVAKSGGGVQDATDVTAAASLTSVLGSSSFNELRALYSDGSYDLDPLDASRGVAVSIPGVATFGNNRLLPQVRDSSLLQLFDSFSFQPGKSDALRFKLGAEYTRYTLKGSLPLNFAGLHRFSALPPNPAFPNGLTARQAFAAGVPAVFAQAFGDPNGDETAWQAAAFLQADIQAGERLMLRLGVRYDYENPIDPFPSDSDNVSPRASFSWAPADAFRVKGGYGRFYGVSAVGPMFAVRIQDGVQVRTHIRTIQGGPSPVVPWNYPDHRFPDEVSAGTSVVPPTVLRPGDYESAYTDQANLGFEVEIGRKLLASVDGVWARGNKVFTNRNVNPIVNPGAPPSQQRPDPSYTDVFLYESRGSSWYKGGTLSLASRFGGPFEMTAFYAYADSEDDYIDWLTEYQPQDPLNPDDERGPSIHAAKHRAVFTGTLTSVGRGGSWLTRDWTLAGIVAWSSGLPYNVTAGYDRNQNGDPVSDRPEGVGRNSETLPDQFTLDLRLSRTVFFAADVGVELIGVCTNVTNRENVLAVQSVANQPNFGQPTLYGPGRIFQLGARFSF